MSYVPLTEKERVFPSEHSYVTYGLEYYMREISDKIYDYTRTFTSSPKTLLEAKDRVLLFKIKGKTFTYGTGNTTYSSPHYEIYLRDTCNHNKYYLQYRVDYDRKTTKVSKDLAYKKFEELCKVFNIKDENNGFVDMGG